MICPYCGWRDNSTPIPRITKTPHKLATCTNCNHDVYAAPTQRNTEHSRTATVREGETHEQRLADALADQLDADRHEDRGKYADIDRAFHNTNNPDPFSAAEIKTRTCTVNAYHTTKFPYRKIEAGQQLTREQDIPVFVVLVFLDGWLFHRIDPDAEYEKGEEDWTPNYRGESAETGKQHPALIPITDFKHIDIREACLSPQEIQARFEDEQ